jgi:hypothetical protein
MGEAYSMHRVDENSCIVLIGIPEGKRPLGRTTRRWEETLKMDLKKTV